MIVSIATAEIQELADALQNLSLIKTKQFNKTRNHPYFEDTQRILGKVS